jgi:SAM-dependent methyltransferase
VTDEDVHEDPDFYRGGAYARGMHEFWLGALGRFYETVPRVGALLDVGAGSGELVAWALADGRQAWGVEPFWPTPSRGILRAVGERLPFAGQSFDVVTCFSVLQDVQNPRSCLAEMARVLRPGGVAVIAVPLSYRFMVHRYRNEPRDLLATLPGDFFEEGRRHVGIRYIVPVVKRTLARMSIDACRRAGRAYLRGYSRSLADMAVVTLRRS